nr:uncharacterized protein LOC105885244 [Microcebus murinus]
MQSRATSWRPGEAPGEHISPQVGNAPPENATADLGLHLHAGTGADLSPPLAPEPLQGPPVGASPASLLASSTSVRGCGFSPPLLLPQATRKHGANVTFLSHGDGRSHPGCLSVPTGSTGLLAALVLLRFFRQLPRPCRAGAVHTPCRASHWRQEGTGAVSCLTRQKELLPPSRLPDRQSSLSLHCIPQGSTPSPCQGTSASSCFLTWKLASTQPSDEWKSNNLLFSLLRSGPMETGSFEGVSLSKAQNWQMGGYRNLWPIEKFSNHCCRHGGSKGQSVVCVSHFFGMAIPLAASVPGYGAAFYHRTLGTGRQGVLPEATRQRVGCHTWKQVYVCSPGADILFPAHRMSHRKPLLSHNDTPRSR